jgi:hypothetical protein
LPSSEESISSEAISIPENFYEYDLLASFEDFANLEYVETTSSYNGVSFYMYTASYGDYEFSVCQLLQGDPNLLQTSTFGNGSSPYVIRRTTSDDLLSKPLVVSNLCVLGSLPLTYNQGTVSFISLSGIEYLNIIQLIF